MVRIIDLYRLKNQPPPPPVGDSLRFDILGDSATTAFNVRRVSDDTPQLVTYGDLLDGSYDAFISGTNGAISDWFGTDGTLAQETPALQPHLYSNYVNDYLQNTFLYMSKSMDMSGDWIVSVIMQGEANPNNQRMNLGIRGTGTNLFAVQFMDTGNGAIILDRLTGPTDLSDYKFSFSNDVNYKLFTFSRISGVFKIHLNNVELTLTPNAGAYTPTEAMLENYMYLGARDILGNGGKITKYKHIGLKTGADATSANLSTYNNSLMTQYGL